MIHTIPMETKTMNLRDLPEDLVRRAKACAAIQGMTLKEFVSEAIEKAVRQDIPARSIVSAMSGHARPAKRRSRRKKTGSAS